MTYADRLKMIFGFMLLVLLAVLAGVIALGKVEEKTSYGLQFILGALSVLAGGFANWAFGRTEKIKDEVPDHAHKRDISSETEKHGKSTAGAA